MKGLCRILMGILSVVLLGACGADTADSDQSEPEIVSQLTGTGGEHKADAPNAVVDWQILQGEGDSLIFRASRSDGGVYLDAVIYKEGKTRRVDFQAPVSCSVVTDPELALILQSTCTREEIVFLGVTAVDYVRDLQSSDMALQLAEQKADGFGDGACAAAQVVVGGLSGLITTFAVFHTGIIETVGVMVLGGGLTISVAGIGMGAAVFALSALGVAWGVDKACDALGVGEDFSTTLAMCVYECDEDDADCLSACVGSAAGEEGLTEGRSECEAACTGESGCSDQCAEAYDLEGNLRQTLLMQCVLGCDDRGESCAESCVEATNTALPQ